MVDVIRLRLVSSAISKALGSTGASIALACCVLFGVSSLSGCAGASAPPEPKPVQATLFASSTINPSPAGDSQRVDLMLFQLSGDTAINDAQLMQLYPGLEKAQAVLGAELIQTKTFQAIPGQETNFELELDDRTRYLAIVAAFEQFGQAEWKDVLQVRDDKLTDKLLLRRERLSIIIDKLSATLNY